MNLIRLSVSLFIAMCSTFLAQAQNAEKSETAALDISVRLEYAPIFLNPHNFVDANAELILRHVFQPLVAIDPVSLSPVPVLAEALPSVEKDSLGFTLLTFNIRPEAQWPSGRSIVARDVAFSIKAFKCPKVNNYERKVQLQVIHDVRLYINAPRKVTLVFKNPTYESFDLLNDLFILDPYHYDPQNLLGRFAVPVLDSLARNEDKVDIDKMLIRFSAKFNIKDHATEDMVGSGPYTVNNNNPEGDYILDKKASWWGDLLQGVNAYFDASPATIRYKIVEDEFEAVKMLSTGQLDVVGNISMEAYNALKDSKQGNKDYYFLEPEQLAFEYIGLNMRKPILRDVLVRKSLTYIVDYDRIVKEIYQNMAMQINSFVPPSMRAYYNTGLPNYTYNLSQAKRQLMEAGWTDTDNDGILEKLIDGVRMPFRLSLAYNNDNPKRKQIAEMIALNARTAGVELEVQGFTRDELNSKLKNAAFDMFIGGWFIGPTMLDPGIIWHRDAQKDGFNYTNFGTNETDSLIQVIRYDMRFANRAKAFKQLQANVANTAPFIYLTAPRYQVVVRKRFKNVQATPYRPGCWVPSFTVE